MVLVQNFTGKTDGKVCLAAVKYQRSHNGLWRYSSVWSELISVPLHFFSITIYTGNTVVNVLSCLWVGTVVAMDTVGTVYT